LVSGLCYGREGGEGEGEFGEGERETKWEVGDEDEEGFAYLG